MNIAERKTEGGAVRYDRAAVPESDATFWLERRLTKAKALRLAAALSLSTDPLAVEWAFDLKQAAALGHANGPY